MLFYFAEFFSPTVNEHLHLEQSSFLDLSITVFETTFSTDELHWHVHLQCSKVTMMIQLAWQTDFWPSGYFFPLSSSSVFLFGFWDFVVFLFFPLYCLELTLHTACPPPSLHPPLLYLIKFFSKLSFPALGLTTGSHQSRNWVLKLQQLSQLAHLLMFGFSDVSS